METPKITLQNVHLITQTRCGQPVELGMCPGGACGCQNLKRPVYGRYKPRGSNKWKDAQWDLEGFGCKANSTQHPDDLDLSPLTTANHGNW